MYIIQCFLYNYRLCWELHQQVLFGLYTIATAVIQVFFESVCLCLFLCLPILSVVFLQWKRLTMTSILIWSQWYKNVCAAPPSCWCVTLQKAASKDSRAQRAKTYELYMYVPTTSVHHSSRAMLLLVIKGSHCNKWVYS